MVDRSERADTRPSPRVRMVRSAAQLIRVKGVSGTGVREVVAHAGAPWGSLQHYFPDGKDQLVSEALTWSADYAARRVGRYMAEAQPPTPAGLFQHITRQWTNEFDAVGFDAGCPLLAATADVAASNEQLRGVLAEAFTTWQRPITAALIEMGVPDGRATAVSTVMVSSLEGAIVLSRVARDSSPLRTVVEELGPFLQSTIASDFGR